MLSSPVRFWGVGLTLIAAVLVESPAALAWGNEGHIYINRVAAQKIPPSLPRFLPRAEVEIAYLGPSPIAGGIQPSSL